MKKIEPLIEPQLYEKIEPMKVLQETLQKVNELVEQVNEITKFIERNFNE